MALSPGIGPRIWALLGEQQVGDVDQRNTTATSGTSTSPSARARVVIRAVIGLSYQNPSAPGLVHGDAREPRRPSPARQCAASFTSRSTRPLFGRRAIKAWGCRRDSIGSKRKRHVGVPAQFGGTHGGPLGARGHDAAAVADKKYRD
jgi:hypothetical protein